MSQFFQSVPGALLLLVIGFVFLVKGADAFVEGSSSIAKIFKVPSLIIGMTIVAMGTSLPETAVSVVASLAGNNTLAISNVVGSNIFNLMIVIGVCAILTPVAVQKVTLKRDFPFSVLCAVLLAVLGFIGGEIGHIDGLILLVLFVGFILSMIHSSRKAMKEGASEEEEIKTIPVPLSILYIILGAVGIALGSDWVVDGATVVSTALGMSQTLIGLTVVAFGTSLPELVTSITAAKKNEVDMALGNAIGSNVFNILMVLGIAGAISPMTFMTENLIDIIVLTVFSVIVWVIAWKKEKINRPAGILMLVLYAAYFAYIFAR